MAPEKPLRLVLCWHMHQPDYRDHLRNAWEFPWVYLHAIKDYTDMAAHLEAVPGARAVVNFSPILLEQIEGYETQLNDWLKEAVPLNDPLLAALETAVFPADMEHRLALVKACLRANRKRMIDPNGAYLRLAQIAELVMHDVHASTYINNQYLSDLVTWYHLAWMGETVRRTDERIRYLIEQGSGFSLHQRRTLLQCIAEQITSVRTRYRKLADEGRVELSTTPYAHPIVPLMLDFKSAREAQPDVRLPVLEAYPGGAVRAGWHIEKGLAVFERFFGRRPRGCWPSEGSVSAATLDLLDAAGFAWTATGEAVLRNSLHRSGHKSVEPNAFYAAWRRPGSRLGLFARDDALSDLIGFTFADWHADDAVAELVRRLGIIADHTRHAPGAVVSIILDGENAWEYYPQNGYFFLSALYRRLAEHPRIRLCTFSEVMETTTPRELTELTAGSWVHGTFSTWIGDEDKNRAWEILSEAKRVYDECLAHGHFDAQKRERLARQLAVCEGSDWFWWFGGYNPAQTVSDFERLFRLHLANLYEMLGREPPQQLTRILAHGSGTPLLGGVIRPGAPPASS